MALDPRISLGVRTANVGEAFSNALLNVQRLQGIQQQPLRNRLLEAQTGQAETGVTEGQQLNKIRSLAVFANDISGDLANNDLASIRQKTVQRIAQDLPNQGVPSTESQDLLNNVIDNPNLTDDQKIAEIGRLSQNITRFAQQAGVLKPAGFGQSAEQKAFEFVIANFSEEDKVAARRVKAGLDPRAIGSAAQTIAAEGTAEEIAITEETLATGKEKGKLKAQLQLKPKIEKAVKLAAAEAAAKGETLTTLKRAEAALPGLNDAVSQLKELAPIATSTLGGKAFDFAVKESGFGSTKGANARAKFIAIINNQVLPLLRDTFGAAFTEREGETLKATMGDPNATPEQKILQLEAFIDQKVRNIQTSQRELATDTDITSLSDDDLLSF